MGYTCEICGKRSSTGNKVSHSNIKTRRTWKPNVQRVLVEVKGTRKRITVCTRCIKSGKVTRPTVRIQPPAESTAST